MGLSRWLVDMAGLARRSGWLLPFSLALLFVGIASGSVSKNHAGRPSLKLASLRVDITGLPARAPALVTVTGPNGFRARLRKSTTRTGLHSGRYAILAIKVKANANTYVPSFASQHVQLVAGKHSSATVAYKRLLPNASAPNAAPSPQPTSTAPGSSGVSPGAPSTGAGGGSSGSGPAPGISVYLGYADSYRPAGITLPSPWEGSPGVTFVGCGSTDIAGPGTDNCPTDGKGKDIYDAGAIRFVNNTGAAVTFNDPSVRIGGSCAYRPWPGLSATIQPGKTLILTQTGGKSPCGDVTGAFNFDTSESHLSTTCKNDGLIPQITVSVDGTPMTVTDSGQILNTGGFGKDECNRQNEFQNWVAVG